MSNLIFEPWIGDNYGKTDFGKLLIIGESHYFYHPETDYANFTKKVIQDFLTSSDIGFYIKIGKVFNPDNCLDIWSKIAFANAIQYAFDKPRQTVTMEQYKTIEPAIREYLDLTMPSKMIVFSKRVWDIGLPENITWGTYIETLYDEEHNKNATVWKFEYTNGHCYGIGIHHPSSINPHFRSEEWEPLVKKFLEKEYL